MLAEIPICPVPLPTKVCSRCKQRKELFHFGRTANCKACRDYLREYKRENSAELSRYNRGYRAKNLDEIKQRERQYRDENRLELEAKNRQWRQTLEGRAVVLFNAARTRRPEGFSLTLDHVVAGLRRGHCEVTGISFDLQLTGKRNRSPYAPSIDRVDPKKPYTDANTRLVIWQYNAMKFELSDAEVLEICRAVVARAA